MVPSIVARLVPAASSGTLSYGSERACPLMPCRSTVTMFPVPARPAVSDLAPHASTSSAALLSNLVPQIETRTAFDEVELGVPAGGLKAPPMTFRPAVRFCGGLDP